MKLVNVHTQVRLLSLVLVFFSGAYLQAQPWTLQQCVDTALVRNKTRQISRNNEALSQLKEQEARANLLPKVTAGADYKYFTHLPYQLLPLSVFNGPEGSYKEARFGVPHNIGANVQLAIPLYSPQIRGAINAAGIARELSALQYQKSGEQVIFEVTNLYYNAQILHHQLAFIDSNLANTGSLLANMKLLREQGLSRGTEVSKIQLQGEQLHSQRAQTDSKLAQVLNALKFLMGLSLDTPLSVQTEIVQQEKAAYSTYPSLDIRMAQVQNRLLVNELNTLQKSRLLPSVSLTANYGLSGFGYDKQPEPFLRFFPVGFMGVQATYPIWNGTIRVQIAQKKKELQNSAIQTDHIQAQNDLMIANATLQQQISERNIQTSLQQIELAKTVYQQTVLQQEQGTAALADVLLADNALREAQQNYLNVIMDYLKADLELKKATGSINQ